MRLRDYQLQVAGRPGGLHQTDHRLDGRRRLHRRSGAEAAGNAMQTLLGRKLLLQGGSATALHWAINSVKKGGIVSIVGVYGPIDTLVPIGNVVNKGLTLRGNQASVKRLLPRLIEHVQNGIIDPKALITHRIPLEYVSDAYRIFSAKLNGCIKPVLIPPSSETEEERHGRYT